MEKNEVTAKIEQLYEKWKKSGGKRVSGPFRLYVAHQDHKTLSAFRKNPLVFRELSGQAQAAWAGIKEPSLSRRVLEQYMPHIARYVVESGGTETLQNFINRLLRECVTEKEVRKFLGLS